MRKNDLGITLIGLVVTIVVLLILAAVSVAMLTGENGIITMANKSKEETDKAKEDELKRLTAIEAATYFEEYEYEDSNGEKITIPAQCAVSQIEGENTLKDGLVIIDANGNEWVWIEVPETVIASATTDEEIKNALISYTIDYRNIYSDTWYNGCGLEEEEYYNNYRKMLQSIKANGGFFIGKYEVGSFDSPVTSEDTTRTAVIQQGAYPYNYVRCSQAQELSEGLAIGGKTSSLMFGIQWDLVLKYLELKGDWDTTTNNPSYYLRGNSSSWGNYNNISFTIGKGKYSTDYGNSYKTVNNSYRKPVSSVLLTTGATDRNNILNIYDLAGNVWEWTLEKSHLDSNPCTHRGGHYNVEGFNDTPGHRNANSTYISHHALGFRPTLW